MLQQHLPFTVLKLVYPNLITWRIFLLQQHLPFTVLKQFHFCFLLLNKYKMVATALTVYGIETREFKNYWG